MAQEPQEGVVTSFPQLIGPLMRNTALDSLKNHSNICSRYVSSASGTDILTGYCQLRWWRSNTGVGVSTPASFLTRAVFVFVWFPVVRPEAASSAQPSSGIHGRLTRYKSWKEVLTDTHTHTGLTLFAVGRGMLRQRQPFLRSHLWRRTLQVQTFQFPSSSR